MAYTVLARRYRSRTFDELVGQEAVVETLLAAIRLNRVAHAYLFTGTRGVGKTSTARLFANALNNPDGDAAIHDAIMQGRDTDTIEIDAASNNSVDNARDLIANSVYRPLRGRRKVYIIDEVHMLSIQAFNALLKTMEEPPEHVVFVLCTTETHKVPATIQSRCQRFDFRPISSARIAEHLGAVVRGEGLQADPELLHMIARLAAGSMRDALSLLDRLMASGQARLTPELLERLLGLPDRAIVASIIDACADADAPAALEVTARLLANGAPIDQAIAALADRFRDLMVIAACGPRTDLVELTDEARDLAARQASRFDPAGLSHMIALCESVGRAARSSAVPRALLDALVVRLAMTEKLADVSAMLAATSAASPAPGPATPRPPAAHAAPSAYAQPGAPAKKR